MVHGYICRSSFLSLGMGVGLRLAFEEFVYELILERSEERTGELVGGRD